MPVTKTTMTRSNLPRTATNHRSCDRSQRHRVVCCRRSSSSGLNGVGEEPADGEQTNLPAVTRTLLGSTPPHGVKHPEPPSIRIGARRPTRPLEVVPTGRVARTLNNLHSQVAVPANLHDLRRRGVWTGGGTWGRPGMNGTRRVGVRTR
uniref:(northern house mosquito) hypothetical protein n=1 Tax=Culex pipiens TaxID=7175 RepID=A0A8D8CEA1_CULPI